MIALAGVSTVSFVALMYGSTIIVPTSACELDTTGAQQGLLVGVPVAGKLRSILLIHGVPGNIRELRYIAEYIHRNKLAKYFFFEKIFFYYTKLFNVAVTVIILL
jgi:hypothetical protein